MTPEPATPRQSPDPVTDVAATAGPQPDPDPVPDAPLPAAGRIARSSANASEFGDPGGLFLG